MPRTKTTKKAGLKIIYDAEERVHRASKEQDAWLALLRKVEVPASLLKHPKLNKPLHPNIASVKHHRGHPLYGTSTQQANLIMGMWHSTASLAACEVHRDYAMGDYGHFLPDPK